jgi:hypothetical protein
MVRAIELSYFFRKMTVVMSGDAKSSTRTPDPVLNAMHDTLGPPSAWAAAVDSVGALDSGGFARDLFVQQVDQTAKGVVTYDAQEP